MVSFSLGAIFGIVLFLMCIELEQMNWGKHDRGTGGKSRTNNSQDPRTSDSPGGSREYCNFFVNSVINVNNVRSYVYGL